MSDAKNYSQAAPYTSSSTMRWVEKTATYSDDSEKYSNSWWTPRWTPTESSMTRMSSVSTTYPDSPTHADELSSTDASDDELSPASCDLTSSDSENGEDFGATVQTCMYSVMFLLRFRSSLSVDNDTVQDVRYGARYISDLDAAPAKATSKASSLSWRSSEGVTSPAASSQRLPDSTAESWIAQQRKSTTEGDDAKVLRAARSILNKLTVEKFESLFEQLTSCGIQQPHHISMLMREIFEKATIQHHFIPMYADLCVRLEKDPTISDVVKEAGELHNFRRLLLNQCQIVFEQVLVPTSIETEQADTDEEMQLVRKQRALGNMKLIGHLLINDMLSSDLFVQCCEELLRGRSQCSEALEALVALMMVVGPTFDKKSWQFYSRLEKILADMKALTKDKQTPPRLRFLIRDVLDAREAGWPSSPKTPTKVTENKNSEMAPEEASSKPAAAVHAQKKAEKTRSPPPASPQKFELVSFRRELAAVLSDLASDKNIPAAVQRIRMQRVPLAFQAEQFVDILCRVVEERRGAVRRCQLAFIAGLVAAENSALDRKECLSGVKLFFQDTYDEMCKDVNRLPGIMKSEFVPTMMTVVPAADINNVVPAAMRK
jgi:hypothetical protein